MRDKLPRLSKAFRNELVKRIPYILVLAIVIGIFVAWKSYNRTALSVTIARENTAAIKKNTEATDKSVTALLDDNAKQTKILCRLILSGKLELTPEEAADVERICQEAVDSATTADGQTPSTPGRSGARPSSADRGVPGSSSSQNNTPRSGGQPDNSQPPDDPDPPPLLIVPQPEVPCITIGQVQVC